jgi:hypothetical protein
MFFGILPGAMRQGENESTERKQHNEDNADHEQNRISGSQIGLVTSRSHAGGAGEKIGENCVQCIHTVFSLDDDIARLPNEERQIEKKRKPENAADPTGCREQRGFLGTKPTQQHPSRVTQQKQGHEDDEENMEEFDRHGNAATII